MNLTCIECKNKVDLSAYPNLAEGHTVECNHCGISLLITAVNDGGEVEAEIADEGK